MNVNPEDNSKTGKENKAEDIKNHIQLKSLFEQWSYLKNLFDNNIFDIISKLIFI